MRRGRGRRATSDYPVMGLDRNVLVRFVLGAALLPGSGGRTCVAEPEPAKLSEPAEPVEVAAAPAQERARLELVPEHTPREVWRAGMALWLLGELGPRARDVRGIVAAHVEHPDGRVAAAARTALARIDAEPSVPPIGEVSRDRAERGHEVRVVRDREAERSRARAARFELVVEPAAVEPAARTTVEAWLGLPTLPPELLPAWIRQQSAWAAPLIRARVESAMVERTPVRAETEELFAGLTRLGGEVDAAVLAQWLARRMDGRSRPAWELDPRHVPGIHGLEEALRGAAPWAVPRLARLVAATSADGRAERDAALALAAFGADAAVAVPALVGVLDRASVAMPGGAADLELRRCAVAALGAIGPAAAPAVPRLVALLAEPELESGALIALGGVGPAAAAAVPAIARRIEPLRPPSQFPNDNAPAGWRLDEPLIVLSRLGAAGVAVLVERLDHPNPEEAAHVVHPLRLAGPAAIPALIALLAE